MDIPLLISSLAGAREAVGMLINERDRQKAAAIQIDLSEKLLQAQALLAEVLGAVISKDAAIGALTERNRQLEAAQSEKARYELAELSVGGHLFAYRLRAAAELSERANEPPHFVCQPCFEGGKKGVLIAGETWGSRTWICPMCKVEITGDRVA